MISFMAIVLFAKIVKFERKASIFVSSGYLIFLERFSKLGEHVFQLVDSYIASVILVEGSKGVLNGQLTVVFLRHLENTVEEIIQLAYISFHYSISCCRDRLSWRGWLLLRR